MRRIPAAYRTTLCITFFSHGQRDDLFSSLTPLPIKTFSFCFSFLSSLLYLPLAFSVFRVPVLGTDGVVAEGYIICSLQYDEPQDTRRVNFTSTRSGR